MKIIINGKALIWFDNFQDFFDILSFAGFLSERTSLVIKVSEVGVLPIFLNHINI